MSNQKDALKKGRSNNNRVVMKIFHNLIKVYLTKYLLSNSQIRLGRIPHPGFLNCKITFTGIFLGHLMDNLVQLFIAKEFNGNPSALPLPLDFNLRA